MEFSILEKPPEISQNSPKKILMREFVLELEEILLELKQFA